jgi:hypothetical protein
MIDVHDLDGEFPQLRVRQRADNKGEMQYQNRLGTIEARKRSRIADLLLMIPTPT